MSRAKLFVFLLFLDMCCIAACGHSRAIVFIHGFGGFLPLFIELYVASAKSGLKYPTRTPDEETKNRIYKWYLFLLLNSALAFAASFF